MMKRGIALGLACILIFTECLATQRVKWSGEGKEAEFSYQLRNGYIEFQITSSYTYLFRASAEMLQGNMVSNASGFVHTFEYLKGAHLSEISADGIIFQTSSVAEIMKYIEQLQKEGCGNVKISIEIIGEEVHLKIEKPVRLDLPAPILPEIKTYYIKDENGRVVGGCFENVGNAVFVGRISFRAGLSYSKNWIAETVTEFSRGVSNIFVTLPPKGKLEFFILMNPAGGLTFVFPSLVYNNAPLSFSIFAPSPDSKAVQNFQAMIYHWWTGYVDPEPQVDYVNTKIYLESVDGSPDMTASLLFFHPIVPYFQPPR